MRTRRLAWVLAVLLSLGSLPAAQAIRTEPHAQIRAIACLVFEDRADERQQAEPTAIPVFPDVTPLAIRPVNVRNGNAWLEAPFRFQRPPPRFTA